MKNQQHRPKWEKPNCPLIPFATPQAPALLKTEKQTQGSNQRLVEIKHLFQSTGLLLMHQLIFILYD